jgi:hypothetical protein
MARRIAAILAMGPTLDANYNAVKLATYVQPTKGLAEDRVAGGACIR